MFQLMKIVVLIVKIVIGIFSLVIWIWKLIFQFWINKLMFFEKLIVKIILQFFKELFEFEIWGLNLNF
jgi:hypothetical protein